MLDKPAIMDSELCRRLVAEEDVGSLVHALFKKDLTPGQEEIARCIAFPDDTMPKTGIGPRVWVTAPTRYGKTEAFADGLGIRYLVDPRPLTCKAVGPRQEQAGIFRDRMARNIIACKELSDKLDLRGGGVERIKKEVSQRKFTFTDGKELSVLSAHGDSDRAMGEGAFITVKDEACLIRREADAKISRMAGDDAEAEVYELANPWDRDNTFADHTADPSWRGIAITLDQAIKEGRITQAWVEAQRKELAPTMFQVLYESRFPDQAEDQLIPWSWIVRSLRKGSWQPSTDEERAAWRREAGADIAEGGMDKTVLAHGWKGPGKALKVTRWQAWQFADTMATAKLIYTELKQGPWPVGIDENGVGKGVADRLREFGHPTLGFKGGRSPRSAQFANAASEALWLLRRAFEEERIELYDPPQALLADLPKWRHFLRGDKTAVEVRGGKVSGSSPDHGDATAMLNYGEAAPQAARKIPRKDPLKRLG